MFVVMHVVIHIFGAKTKINIQRNKQNKNKQVKVLWLNVVTSINCLNNIGQNWTNLYKNQRNKQTKQNKHKHKKSAQGSAKNPRWQSLPLKRSAKHFFFFAKRNALYWRILVPQYGVYGPNYLENHIFIFSVPLIVYYSFVFVEKNDVYLSWFTEVKGRIFNNRELAIYTLYATTVWNPCQIALLKLIRQLNHIVFFCHIRCGGVLHVNRKLSI